MSDEDKILKNKLPVEIERDDGSLLMGFLFVGQTARLSDLLNDKRVFLPFETSLGKFFALKKESIVTVTPLDQAQESYEGQDAYRILGVTQSMSFVEIKQAYIRLCTEHHPDKIRGLGLADEYVELANLTLSRINEAFQRIAKASQAAHAEAATEARNQRSDAGGPAAAAGDMP